MVLVSAVPRADTAAIVAPLDQQRAATRRDQSIDYLLQQFLEAGRGL